MYTFSLITKQMYCFLLVFDMAFLNEVVDFFVVNSYEYVVCDYHDHQENMAPPTNADDFVCTILYICFSTFFFFWNRALTFSIQ